MASGSESRMIDDSWRQLIRREEAADVRLVDISCEPELLFEPIRSSARSRRQPPVDERWSGSLGCSHGCNDCYLIGRESSPVHTRSVELAIDLQRATGTSLQFKVFAKMTTRVDIETELPREPTK